jgi:uncharacterized protein GlcG (DUF336 family)
MYDRATLSLDEALKGINRALELARGDGSSVVVAILDHRGDLIAYGADDDPLSVSRTMALQKAYSAAVGRQSSGGYARKIDELLGNPVELHLGPRATSALGGTHIRRSGDGLPLAA